MEVKGRIASLNMPKIKKGKGSTDNNYRQPIYLPNSYKFDQQYRSVDWGPKLPEAPETEKKKFMKIDYLRFKDKKQFQQVLDQHPYESDTQTVN